MTCIETTEPDKPVTVGSWVITPIVRCIVLSGGVGKNTWIYASKELVAVKVETKTGDACYQLDA